LQRNHHDALLVDESPFTPGPPKIQRIPSGADIDGRKTFGKRIGLVILGLDDHHPFQIAKSPAILELE
jgi:hypothetical protein